MKRISVTDRDVRVKVTLYTATGRQLFFFKVNPVYCRECDMTVNVVERALRELDNVSVKLEVKPWLTYVISSFFRGGYHPPVLLVDNNVVSQGVVPANDEVKRAIVDAWEKRAKLQKKRSSDVVDKIRRHTR